MPDLTFSARLTDSVAVGDVFSADQCREIVELGLNDWDLAKAYIGDGQGEIKEDTSTRSTILYKPRSNVDWITNKLVDAVTQINKQIWQFEISELSEPPVLMVYEPGDGFYEWHLDIGASEQSATRKLSFSVLLNPADYDGGGLEFMKSGRPSAVSETQAGTMILFPSYLLHRVLAGSGGTRYTLVGWVNGPSYK